MERWHQKDCGIYMSFTNGFINGRQVVTLYNYAGQAIASCAVIRSRNPYDSFADAIYNTAYKLAWDCGFII